MITKEDAKLLDECMTPKWRDFVSSDKIDEEIIKIKEEMSQGKRKDQTELSVEINGKFYKANVQAKPLYDPEGKKMRG